MSEQLTVYEKAVTTHRPAELLARCHGYESLAQLAESLPTGAHVLDVGAGASPFGKEVAVLRPDVTWVNFDYSYRDPTIFDEVIKDAPDNIQHVAGDATRLSEQYEPYSFDVVFSYWLLPHLSLDNTEPAKQVATAIFDVTKSGGLMSVGPRVSHKRLPSLKSGKAIQVIKDATVTADSFTERVVTETKLPKIGRYIQKRANEVATPFFGTSRYAKREGRIPQVYHPESGEYVSPFTRQAVQTAGRLAVAMARQASRQRKQSKL